LIVRYGDLAAETKNIFWQKYFFSENFDMADLSQNRWYRYSIIGGAFKLQELAYLPQF